MPSALSSVRNFLAARKTTYSSDLVDRFLAHADCMEIQVNVYRGDGERVDGTKSTFSKGTEKWFSYRIPRHADSEPEFKDYELGYALDDHADAIGSTGWDWVHRVSRWVGFDFDSIIGHAVGVGVTPDTLGQIRQAAMTLPYVEARRSTGGTGLHLYVQLDAIPTATHTEHAALARCILGCMSRDAGYDFSTSIDCCGGNMWLWRRKQGENGFELLKPAETTFNNLPENWKEHIAVIQRRRSKVRINGISTEDEDPFDLLASSHRRVPLDDKHKAIMTEMEKSGASVIWVPDHHLLQTHTKAFDHVANGTESCQFCHGTGIDPEFDDDLGMIEPPPCQKCNGIAPRIADRLGIRGVFQTNSPGNDLGSPNCFAFPLDNGGWKVYRFSPGISEAKTWECDGKGWTTCTFNALPDLRQACIGCGGRELRGGGYEFDSVRDALRAATILNPKADIQIESELIDRPAVVRTSKDGRFTLEVQKKEDDPTSLGDWNSKDKRGHWTQVLPVSTEKPSENNISYEDMIRCVETSGGEPAGWAVKKRTDGSWSKKSASSVKTILQSLGHPKPEAEEIMGYAEHAPWTLVCQPFQPEYPGDRQWNFRAPQIKFERAEGLHPHWDLIWNHVGSGLDEAVSENEWCRDRSINTGGDFLRLGIAVHLRHPNVRLPLMTMYSRAENTGKSTTIESLNHIIGPNGVVPITEETLKKNFNGTLATAWIAVISESDASKSREKIKDWVTTKQLQIRKMYTDEALTDINFWLWHALNDVRYSPVSEYDDRIIMWEVPTIENRIGPLTLANELTKEAPAFLDTLMSIPIPQSSERLFLPILQTSLKEQAIGGQTQETDAKAAFIDFLTSRIERGSESDYITRDDLLIEYDQYVKKKKAKQVGRQQRLKTMIDAGFAKTQLTGKQSNTLCEGRSQVYTHMRWKPC